MKLLVLASDPVGADDVREALPDDDDVAGAEVLVVAPAVNESPVARYREDDVVGEAERRFGVPVTEVTR